MPIGELGGAPDARLPGGPFVPEIVSRESDPLAHRLVRAEDAVRCCEKRSATGGNKAGVIRLLGDIAEWIGEIKGELQTAPTTVSGRVASVDGKTGRVVYGGPGFDDGLPGIGTEVPWSDQLTLGLVVPEFLPQTGSGAIGEGLPRVGGQPFPGAPETDFSRLLSRDVGGAARPMKVPLVDAGGWAAAGMMLGAIALDAYYSWTARQSSSALLQQMEHEFNRQLEKLRSLPEDDERTEDCRACIEAALLKNTNKQKVYHGKGVRKRIKESAAST